MIESVKIGAMTYKVELVEDLHMGEGDERKDLHGQIWPDKLQIDVQANQDAQMQAATILHESLHGILNQAGQDHEERLIIALGYGLVQFIRDNLKLIDLLQHGERGKIDRRLLGITGMEYMLANGSNGSEE